jgi:hypothetical protein
MAHQISVFAENKPGRIEHITGILKEAGVNIRAITIASSDDFGVVKLLVDQPNLAYEKLVAEGVSASKKEVLALLMNDQPGGLHQIAHILGQKNINIEDAYGFVIQDKQEAVLVLEIEKMPEAATVLREKGVQVLTDEEVYSL